MTNSDDRKEEGTQRNPEWWEGAPEPGSPWESQPHQQVPPSDPTVVRGPYGPPGYGPSGPNPVQPSYGAGPYQSGPPLQQSGPAPQQSGPMPQQSYPSGSNPYQSGQNPYQSGQTPYPTGPAGYQTGPQYGGPPTGGGGNRKALLLGGIALAVVVLVAIVAVVLVTRDSKEPVAQPTTTPSTAASATTTKPTTTTSRTPAALIPGYQVVVPKGIQAAWDVPKDWTLDTTTTEFGTGADVVPVAGLASEGTNYCTDFVRTNMWLSATQTSDAAASAKDIGEKVARVGWSTGSGITTGAPEPFSTSDNALSGTFLETKGTFTSSDPRCAKTFSVYTFAVSGGASSSLVLTIAADTGVDRSVDAAFAKKLFATFRLI